MLRNWRFLIALMILPAAACIRIGGGGDNNNDNGGEDTVTLSANLTGAGEVPPVLETNTTGTVAFEYHPDDDELHYTLNVSNGIGITAAHIHAGAAGVNGPVVAFLFAAEDDVNGISVDGELESGIVTAADLLDTLQGFTVQDLIDVINTEGAYVNVHSSANPGGEVRGQIELDE